MIHLSTRRRLRRWRNRARLPLWAGAVLLGAASVAVFADYPGKIPAHTVLANPTGSAAQAVPTVATAPVLISGSAISIALATDSSFGVIQPDGTTCTVTIGILTCPGSGGGLTGTGTLNTVAKWTGATSLGDSSITDDGTTVTIQPSGGTNIFGGGPVEIAPTLGVDVSPGGNYTAFPGGYWQVGPSTSSELDANTNVVVYSGSAGGGNIPGYTQSLPLIGQPVIISDLNGNPPLSTSISVHGHYGELAIQKITDPASAPNAGYLKFTVEAGTNSGTCKIVTRAGTSATPIVLIDNVGAGC